MCFQFTKSAIANLFNSDWSFAATRPSHQPITFARCGLVFVRCHDDGRTHHMWKVLAKPRVIVVSGHLYDSLTTELYGGTDVG